MEPHLKTEESIFADALDLPASDRAAFVTRACGEDVELRARVKALLRAYDGAGAALEPSPVSTPASAARAESDVGRYDYPPGTCIDRYKLLQKLGEGGCGVVWMAEQEKPVRRRVAVKVIKLGMDTREVIARFEAERQALALMDHPNIAHVLDAGATESGRPFFVMELVRGTPITRYCDEHGVGTDERLHLFTQVCHAIQHAHQKGIIHRDLKPSNILVTLHDGVPVPKVIDFGIAKATQGRLTDKTMFTAFEQFIGTPAYMAPEQTEMNAYDVDTRSDIYSLGVLLYELLTGRTPFESRELARAGLDEMRRVIREREPRKPSTWLSTIDAATGIAIARQRGTEPGRLSAMLRGDLDWIVMRCLEKDRTRRYETANGLAQDLERHRRGEPVAARPPRAAYLLQRLVRRNKLAFLAGGAVALSLVAGLGAALAAWEHAAAEAARSAQVARFMQDMLAGVGPQAALGRDTQLLRAIVDETSVRMQQELQGQPEVEANLRETLGHVYRDLGEYAAARVMYECALQLRREFFGADSAAVGSSLHDLGDVLAREGRLVEAEARLREALVLREKTLRPEDVATEASRALLSHVRMLAHQKSGPGESNSTRGGEPADVADRPAAIRIAFPGGVSGAKPVLANIVSVAYQQRVLENEFGPDGIRIEWISHANSRALYEADSRALADFSSMGPATAMYARANAFGYHAVFALRRFDANFCLVVPVDSPVYMVADLKGRRLAVGGGFFRHLSLCRILSAHGLGVQDCELLQFDGPAGVRTAFAAGEVDGRLVDMDDPTDRVAAGSVRVLHDTGRDLDRVGMGQLCVATEFERRYPALVQRVVTALIKTAAWACEEENRVIVLQLWAISPEHRNALERNYAGYTLKERISPLMDESFLTGIRRDNADAKRFGLIDPEADTSIERWVEPHYLDRALAELKLQSYWRDGSVANSAEDGP